MRTYKVLKLNGQVITITAEGVTFELGHVAFWTKNDDRAFLVLAINSPSIVEIWEESDE